MIFIRYQIHYYYLYRWTSPLGIRNYQCSSPYCNESNMFNHIYNTTGCLFTIAGVDTEPPCSMTPMFPDAAPAPDWFGFVIQLDSGLDLSLSSAVPPWSPTQPLHQHFYISSLVLQFVSGFSFARLLLFHGWKLVKFFIEAKI